MTPGKIMDLVDGLSSEETLRFYRACARAYLSKSVELRGWSLADVVGEMTEAWGCVIITADVTGLHLVDGWHTDSPRGAELTRVMDKLHEAISAVIDGECTRITETDSRGLPS